MNSVSQIQRNYMGYDPRNNWYDNRSKEMQVNRRREEDTNKIGRSTLEKFNILMEHSQKKMQDKIRDSIYEIMGST